ncbi:hypothetical protein V6N11_073112 [Hibiscus sabdariffa]|uniref:Uncharacterized protein n=1 Tax=Hibiscus sabdariffa TaxID=183260 RepID=A0ABR2P9J9_9ROSI
MEEEIMTKWFGETSCCGRSGETSCCGGSTKGNGVAVRASDFHAKLSKGTGVAMTSSGIVGKETLGYRGIVGNEVASCRDIIGNETPGGHGIGRTCRVAKRNM